MTKATASQKNKLSQLGIPFDENIGLIEARDLLRENLPEVPMRKYLSQRPEIFDSVLVRSEMDGVRYMDDVRYIS